MIALIITLVVVFIVGFAWGYGIHGMMNQTSSRIANRVAEELKSRERLS